MSAVRTSLVLALAREYVEAGWTQGVSSKDAAGLYVHPESKTAKCWCSVGAIEAAGYALGGVDVSDAGALMSRVTNHHNVAYWNDMRGRTRDQVIAAFGSAMRLAADT